MAERCVAARPLLVFGGVLYRRVVKRWEERRLLRGIPGGVHYAGGDGRGIGEQLSALNRWLAVQVQRRAA